MRARPLTRGRDVQEAPRVATFADGKIEAYVGPRALGAADDLEAEIVRFIDEAVDRYESKRLASHLAEEIDRILADSEPWRPPRPPDR